MIYKPGGAYYKEFIVSNPTTGAATNADALPTATANRNGTDDATFTLTVTNLDAGRYKITGTVPAGYVAGDVVNVSVAATVGGVAAKGIVDTFSVDTRFNGDDFNATQKTSITAAATAATPTAAAVTAAVTVTGDFSATMKTSLNAATPASVQNIAAQTGDAYARIGAAGAGLTALGDTRIANLDTTVSSRLAPGGTLATVTNLTNAVTLTSAYDAAKTAASQASVNAIPTNPLLASAYTAPDNSDIAAIKADVENATYGLNALLTAITASSGSSAPSAATVAAAVWDTAISGHLTAGTTGSSLNAAGSAGDPWATVLPGVYGSGTAGSIIGSRLDAAVSSRNAIAPDNTSIGNILSAVNDGVHGLAALLAAINSRLAATAYTAPDNADVAAIKADVESATYGLAAIKSSLGSISLDLSPVTSRLDDSTFGLAAIKGSITDIADPLATVVEGSAPPMTRGQAIDQLYIAGYVGPVRTIPAAPTPEQQTLYGYAREFAATTWSAGDVVTMTINPNQDDSAGTILKPETRTTTVDSNGMFALTPDKGAQNVTVKLIPAGGGQPYYRKTICEISQDDEMNITAY